MYDTTKMYPTESFVWSLGYVKDCDRRPVRFDPRADRGQASGRGGRCAVSCSELLGLCGGWTAIAGVDSASRWRGAAAATHRRLTVTSWRFQSPDDETGGYVQATVTPGMGTVRATIYDGAGRIELASFVADAPGAALSFYWASAPSQETRIAIRDEGGAPYTYQLSSTYTPVADPVRAQRRHGHRAPMPEGGQMSAYLFAGRHDAANDPAAYDDYYRFLAQPGALSIRLDDVPPTWRPACSCSGPTAARWPRLVGHCAAARWR